MLFMIHGDVEMGCTFENLWKSIIIEIILHRYYLNVFIVLYLLL